MNKSIDNAVLAYFRIAFGLLMCWEIVHEFTTGNVKHVWVLPEVHFKYLGFDWVNVWPGDGMYIHFAVLGVLALLIAVGLLYRFATLGFCLGFAWILLAEKTAFQNHFYLIVLIAGILFFIPANRRWSLDSAWGRVGKSATAPAWPLMLLRFQFGIVYFFGGLAKINDDWLAGEPVRMWMAAKADLPVFGAISQSELTVYFIAYGGLFFDLLIAPLLLWKRTRWFAVAAAVFFHLSNNYIFSIGIFPWFALAALPLFFPPEDFAQFVNRIRKALPIGSFLSGTRATSERPTNPVSEPLRPLAGAVLGLYVLVQVAVPLRQYLYPGDQSWTQEAHYFSWRMMLRDKQIVSQVFTLTDDRKNTTQVVRLADHLQLWHAKNMLESPDTIQQFARHIASRYADVHGYSPAVFADVRVSLNGKPARPLVDPRVDLVRARRSLLHSDWITVEP